MEPREALAKLYLRAHEQYQQMYDALQWAGTEFRKMQDEGQLIDCAYMLRELAKLLDDSRKSCSRLQDFCEKLSATLWVSRTANDMQAANTSPSGKLAYATYDVIFRLSLPSQRREPEDYAAMMSFLGVPQDQIDRGTVRPDWNGIGELLSEMNRKGEALPKCFESRKQYEQFSVVLRKKRKTDLVEELERITQEQEQQ